jgi:hypothetical protein
MTLWRQHMVPGRQRQENRRRCRHAAGEQQGLVPAFQGVDDGLGLIERRVVGPGVHTA